METQRNKLPDNHDADRPTLTTAPAANASPARYPEALWREIVHNVLERYGNGDIGSMPEEPEALERLANETLREAETSYALEWVTQPGHWPIRVIDHGKHERTIHERTRLPRSTEYGTFIPPHTHNEGSTPIVDWRRVIGVLADLHFLESVYYKVSRLSVVSDSDLYPYWIAGKRKHRRKNHARPEMGIHHRFLEALTPRREARLYRAITPRWEIRRDRVTGLRRWLGRRIANHPVSNHKTT